MGVLLNGLSAAAAPRRSYASTAGRLYATTIDDGDVVVLGARGCERKGEVRERALPSVAHYKRNLRLATDSRSRSLLPAT